MKPQQKTGAQTPQKNREKKVKAWIAIVRGAKGLTIEPTDGWDDNMDNVPVFFTKKHFATKIYHPDFIVPCTITYSLPAATKPLKKKGI